VIAGVIFGGDYGELYIELSILVGGYLFGIVGIVIFSGNECIVDGMVEL
jgi:hypothetical protein